MDENTVKVEALQAQAEAKAASVALASIIQPTVADRWKGLMRRSKYTPADVLNLLNSSFGTRINALATMFELMEESWPRLGTNLFEIRTSVSRHGYDVKPHTVKGAKPTTTAQEKAKFVEEMIFSMRPNPITGQSGFVDMVFDLMDAYGKGFVVMEIDWERGEGGTYRPAATRWIKPVHYDYPKHGDENERLMIDVAGDGVLLEDFPENKFIVGRFAFRSGTSAVTQGCLRMLAPWWVYTNFSTEWMMQYAQVFGMPIRVGKYQSPSNMEDIGSMLEQMGQCAWGVFPVGTELELHESGRAAADNPQAYILARTDELADKVILGNTLTSGTGGVGGRSLALGEVHERTQEGRVGSCSQWVCETITNQLIRAIIRLNYGNEDELPELMPEEGDSTPEQKIMVDKVLIGDLGLEVSKEWLYDRYDIPQPDDGDEIFQPASKLAADQNMAMQQSALDAKTAATASQPAKPVSNKLAAKIGSLPIPDVVVQALEGLTDEMQDHYISQISAKCDAHFPKGQPGGGRFKSKEVMAAEATVRGVMDKYPALPPNRGRRHISCFGMKDNSWEFRNHNTPGLFDRVDQAARNVKTTSEVNIKDLKTTQGSVDTEKVLGMLSSATGTELVHQSPIVIKKGGHQWLWDGHHRAVKACALNKHTIHARLVDLEA